MVLKSTYSWVYVIHIVFVASILYLSGHFGMILGKKAEVDDYDKFFEFMKITAAVTLLYHLYKLVTIESDIVKYIKKMNRDYDYFFIFITIITILVTVYLYNFINSKKDIIKYIEKQLS